MIWLIGNKGMLGTEVEGVLRERRASFVATDREVDVTSLEQLQRFARSKPLEWIINCSAYTAVDQAEEDQERAFQINGDGVRNIAEVARGKGAKLIHISTDYVFAGTKVGEYVESDEPNPINAYGRSKLRGEASVQETLAEHFIIRVSWLYGRFGANFVLTMQRLFNERDEIGVVGDQCGSPTAAADAAALLLNIVDANATSYGIYHFSNDGVTSWYDFACEIYRLSRECGCLSREVAIKRLVSADYPTRAHRPQNTVMSKEKIKRELGVVIKPWSQSLREYVFSHSGVRQGRITPFISAPTHAAIISPKTCNGH